MQSRQTDIESNRVFLRRPAQLNMNEEKKDKKTERFGIIALATAVLSWGCVIGAIPFGVFAWFPLLAVSTVTAVLSRKTVLGKTAIVLLILEIPGYLSLHFVFMAPAS